MNPLSRWNAQGERDELAFDLQARDILGNSPQIAAVDDYTAYVGVRGLPQVGNDDGEVRPVHAGDQLRIERRPDGSYRTWTEHGGESLDAGVIRSADHAAGFSVTQLDTVNVSAVVFDDPVIQAPPLMVSDLVPERSYALTQVESSPRLSPDITRGWLPVTTPRLDALTARVNPLVMNSGAGQQLNLLPSNRLTVQNTDGNYHLSLDGLPRPVIRSIGALHGVGQAGVELLVGSAALAGSWIGTGLDDLVGQGGLLGYRTDYFQADRDMFDASIAGLDKFVRNHPLDTIAQSFGDTLDRAAELSTSDSTQDQLLSGNLLGHLSFDVGTAVDGGIGLAKTGYAGTRLAARGAIRAYGATSDVLSNIRFSPSGDGYGSLSARAQLGAVGDDLAGYRPELLRQVEGSAESVPGNVVDPVQARLLELTAQGHGVQRHGAQVTEFQMQGRAVEGLDPMTGTSIDGVHGGTHQYAQHATKVVSDEAYVFAENYGRNSQQFLDKTAASMTGRVQLEVPLQEIYGEDFRNFVTGVTRYGPKASPTGFGNTIFSDDAYMVIRYKQSPSGAWEFNTMFPQPER